MNLVLPHRRKAFQAAPPAFEFVETFDATGYDNAGWSAAGPTDPDNATSPAPLAGPYSCLLTTGGSNALWRDVSARSSFYIYLRVWFNAMGTLNSHRLLQTVGGGSEVFRFRRTSTTQMDLVTGSRASADWTVILNTDLHMWIEWEKNTGAGDNVSRLFVSTNGVKPETPEILQTNGNSAIDVDMFNFRDFGNGAGTIIDNVIVDIAPIGDNPI